MIELSALRPSIYKLVKQHLDFDDGDHTLSQFLLNLYDQSAQANAPSDVWEAFNKAVLANGGDDFPPQFIKDVYDTVSQEFKQKHSPNTSGIASDPGLSEESSRSRAERAKPLRNTKTVSFSGLSIPDSKPNPTVPSNSSTPREAIPNEVPKLEENAVYRGYVSSIMPYGAFIRLHSPSSRISGLCHVSKMLFDGTKRIRHPQDVLAHGQEVFVKIASLGKEPNARNQKISLSLVAIDQITGIDKLHELQEMKERGRAQFGDHKAAKRRRLTSPERWEIRQLIASGAASAADYPELNGFQDDNSEIAADTEEIFDVELNTDEPDFLKGQLKGPSTTALSIIKTPEGSMSRAALNGSKLAREIRDEKIFQQKELQRGSASKRDSSDPLSQIISKHESQISEKTDSIIASWRAKQSKLPTSIAKPASIKQQRESLPIYSKRAELLDAIKANQFLVIVGETGSGKTTQIVQYVYEEHLNVIKGAAKMIGCTQPRRVAAVSVAKRVSEEMGCKVGDKVGYTIRFEDKTSPLTQIKYMTDGMLQREALIDPSMLRYSLIMLDEAHERTIATDVLFALLKKAAAQNPDLKVIVTSATLDSDKFSSYFNNCPILSISGRTFPVEVLFSREPEVDYLAAALDCVMQIHVAEPEGDILVFLTGQDEIETSVEALLSRIKTLGSALPELIVVPVYAALPSEMQARIFEPAPKGARKVVLATNIAETSITIDGIKYVVDPGFVKVNTYDPRLGMDSLVVSPISRAQAKQRSGRAGRTGPGKCFRLYTESAFQTEMLPNSVPEIQRKNLAATILMLKAMGINDLTNFEFMDPPPAQTMINALHELYTLEALDDNGYLTSLGRQMAEFPMEPALAKTVIASVQQGCTAEVLTIVAMLSVQTVFYRPKEKQNAADQRKQRFHSIHGDHLTLLNVFKAWELSGRSSRWCKDNFIHERSMRRAQDVKAQLATIMKRFKLDLSSTDDTSCIRKTLCSGFFRNLAKRDPHEGIYNTLLDHTPVHMHPSLAIYGRSVEYVIYHTLLLTSKEYMHCATAIDSKWLVELAPKFFKKGDPVNISDPKKKQKIVPLFNRYAENQDSWRLTAQVEAKKKALGLLHQ